MTPLELFEKASGGNKEAYTFLRAVYEHLNAVEKFIADGKKDPHEFIALMAKTNQCFSLPFYQKHAEELRIPVLRAVNDIGTERIPSLVLDVSYITLGFEGARKLLVELKGKE